MHSAHSRRPVLAEESAHPKLVGVPTEPGPWRFESSRAHEGAWWFAGVSEASAIMSAVDESDVSSADHRRRDAAVNEAARIETLRADASRSLGENLEQADALIKAAFELPEGFSAARR